MSYKATRLHKKENFENRTKPLDEKSNSNYAEI